MSNFFRFLHYGSLSVFLLDTDMPNTLEYENFCTVGVFRVIESLLVVKLLFNTCSES